VLEVIGSAGLGVEVFTPFELKLAQTAGFAGQRIIVNGPAKSELFLNLCLDADVRSIVADSPAEVHRLATLARARRRQVSIMLRANIDFVPHGMNPGTATGSRHSVFGTPQEELDSAVRTCCEDPLLRLTGLHAHIGSGIQRASDYREACRRMCGLALRLWRTFDIRIDCLDLGGGYGVPMDWGGLRASRVLPGLPPPPNSPRRLRRASLHRSARRANRCRRLRWNRDAT
jgi:diaminopimelate decarboxylase